MLLMAVLSVGCTSDPQRSQIVDSPVVPFEELFAPADTIRLDPSIIIGGILFMDVNQEGDFLVSDGIGNSVNLFSSSGEHLRTYSVQECLPDLESFQPFSSRFMGTGRVVTMGFGGAVVVFSADGRCVGATRHVSVSSLGFCASGDSIFFLGLPLSKDLRPTIVVNSPELQRLREIPVEWPEFPVLNAGRSGIPGRNIDCFDDGPYYTYLGSMDAMPARFDAESAQQRLEFFAERPRDLSPNMSSKAKIAEWDKYLATSAFFALDSQTRMVVYRNLDDRWQPEGLKDARMCVQSRLACSAGVSPARVEIRAL